VELEVGGGADLEDSEDCDGGVGLAGFTLRGVGS
jgi:hypothetical protein